MVFLNLHVEFDLKHDVGAFHSATGAIESALKYASPDAHWIARRLATAGGKRLKMRPLGTVVTDWESQGSFSRLLIV
jgi:hypothetical protein